MKKPKYINAKTALPFMVKRNLQLENKRLAGVWITIERADFSPETVESEGFAGDWAIALSVNPKFKHLTDEEIIEAEDCVCCFVEDLAGRLSRGEDVPVDADLCQDWHAKSNWNY